jgi:hypothetical protein
MLKHRMQRIERAEKAIRSRSQRREDLAQRAAPQENSPGHITEEEWLSLFESWGREGFFDSEPDFPTALMFYRAALQKAKAQADPPWDPPDDFMPGEEGHRRRFEWRHGGVYQRVGADGNLLPEGTGVNRGLFRRFSRFPEVEQGWQWLTGMTQRRAQSVPPLTLAEFEELACWFEVNRERLTALSRPSYLLEVGDGKTDSVSNLCSKLDEGPRGWEAGEVAEQIRRLRARYGEQ